jgi:glycosyltransferase involved in cell wall biosynthesis
VTSERSRGGVSTLVLMKWATDAGYAITPLERLFYEIGVILAQGDAGRVHFGFTDLSPGPPASLPAGFSNLSAINITDGSPATLDLIGRLVADHGIDFVLTFDMQPVHPMYRVMRQAGARTIISYWGAPISAVSPAWKLAIKRALIRWSNSRLDGLIFESQAMADLAVLGRGVAPAMIDVIPLGVDIAHYRPAASTHVHDAFGIPLDHKTFVFSGHCTPRKGIGTLIEAAIEVIARRGRRDITVLVFGNRGEESRPYEAMYAGLGIDDAIRFEGYCRNLLPVFQSAYCGIIPSSGWDSFPRSSVEMAASGLPVIASRLQGLAEAVRHNETGLLFEPGNAQELADCIVALADDPARAKAYGRAGRVRAERELSLEVQRTRFLDAVQRRLPQPVPVEA